MGEQAEGKKPVRDQRTQGNGPCGRHKLKKGTSPEWRGGEVRIIRGGRAEANLVWEGARGQRRS